MADDTKETWANEGRGDVYIRTLDYNNRLVSTAVKPGRKVQITTLERKLNQERAISEDKDIFRNGSLVPVGAFDNVEDYVEIASNPNLLSGDDLKDLLKLKAPTLKKRLAEITNVLTVTRLHELAQADEASVTMPQFRAIEERIAELSGDTAAEMQEVETIV